MCIMKKHIMILDHQHVNYIETYSDYATSTSELYKDKY